MTGDNCFHIVFWQMLACLMTGFPGYFCSWGFSSLTFFFISDVVLVHTYVSEGNLAWGLLTVLVVALPQAVVHLVSYRWHVHDQESSTSLLIVHCCQLGVFLRWAAMPSKEGWSKDGRWVVKGGLVPLFVPGKDVCLSQCFYWNWMCACFPNVCARGVGSWWGCSDSGLLLHSDSDSGSNKKCKINNASMVE